MSRTRVFLGVAVADPVRDAAVALQATLAKSGAGVKWVSRDNLHVTLLFLGELDDRDLVTVCRTVSAVAAGEPAFRLRVSGVGAFPTPRRPKVLWAGVTDGATELARLYTALEARLVDQRLYVPEERGYTPHLTLGRSNGEADGQLLAAELPKHRTWSAGETAVGELLVYSSELRRGGPEYAVLARGPLG